MSEKIELSKTVVKIRTGANRSKRAETREGYKDQNGQVYLPPTSHGDLKAWLKRYDLD